MRAVSAKLDAFGGRADNHSYGKCVAEKWQWSYEVAVNGRTAYSGEARAAAAVILESGTGVPYLIIIVYRYSGPMPPSRVESSIIAS